MAAASNYLETAIINHVLGNATFTQPATLYLAAFTSDNGLEAGDTSGEVTGGSYSREVITFGDAVGPTASNDSLVVFDTATADWGSITHLAIMDAATGGNVLYHGSVGTSKDIFTGDTFQLATGNLSITLA